MPTIHKLPNALPKDPATPLAMSFVRNQPNPGTAGSYQMEISLFSHWSKKRFADVGLQDFLSYREDLDRRGIKPVTIAKKLTILRIFFRFLCEHGAIPKNPTSGLNLPKIKNETTREIISLEECQRLLASIETKTVRGKRDKAIVALLLVNGLRVCEIARANIADLTLTEECWVLRVRGKGGKMADTRIRDDVYTTIREYLDTRKSVRDLDPIFIGTTHRSGPRMIRRTIQHMVKMRLKKIGVSRPHVSTHSLRHSSITHLINGGATLIAAQDFARHSNPATTQRYFHNLERIKKHPVLSQPIHVE